MYLGHSKAGQFQVNQAAGALAFLVISCAFSEFSTVDSTCGIWGLIILLSVS
jgi:hypothetical protein